MAKAKEPIALIIAKGKKNLTKEEIEIREKQEIKVDAINVKPPSYLSAKQKKEFIRISDILLKIGIITELDEDCLARYLIAKDMYIEFTKMINKEMKNLKLKQKELEKLKLEETIKTEIEATRSSIMATLSDFIIKQNLYFNQSRAAATDMGLSISSRCKLIMPTINEPEQKKNKFDIFKVG